MLGIIEISAIGVVGLAGVWFFGTHSRLIALDERCETAFSDIDVLMKHRHSLIPGILQTVRDFVGYERETFNAVLDTQQLALRSTSLGARMRAETALSQNITNLMQVANQVPELKAERHFVELRNEFTDVENRITAARRFYNNTVEEHNRTLRQFPGSLMSIFSGVSRRDNFDLGADRYVMDEPVNLAL